MELLRAASSGNLRRVGELIGRGADVNWVHEKTGESALYAASRNGHTQVARLLLENGAQQSTIGAPPLHIASQNGHTEVVNLLLQNGAQVGLPNRNGASPLHIATGHGHTEVVNLLLQNGAQVDLQDNNGWSPLHIASEKGHTEVANLLLQNGAQVGLPNRKGASPLHIASGHGHTEVATLLLQNHTQVNLQDNNGWSPLHIASEKGHTEVVNLLLQNGAQVDLPNKNGATPLHIASGHGHTEVANLLLQNGAQVNTQDNNGWSPLHIASEKGHTEVANLLLQNGAQVNTQDNNGWSPLHIASEKGHTEVVNLLLQNGAQVDLPNRNGASPLHIASNHQHTEVANLLLQNGAQVDLQEYNGWSPLHIACKNGHTELANLLLQNHDQVDLPNTSGSTPLYIASHHGHTEVANLLLQKGAQIYLESDNGQSPLTIAIEKRHTEIVQLFQSRRNSDAGHKCHCKMLIEHIIPQFCQPLLWDWCAECTEAQNEKGEERNTEKTASHDLPSDVDQLHLQIRHLKEVIQVKDRIKKKIIQAKDQEILRKDREISRKTEEIQMKNKVLRDEIKRKNMQITEIQRSLGSERNSGNFLLESSLDAKGSDLWNIPCAEVRAISKMKIGSGAWGEVFSGKFRGEEVAIKQAHREILQHVSTIGTLKREILIMAHIQHPNLVRFIGAVLDEAVEDTPIIISELLDMNLRDAYSKEDLGRNVIPIFCDVAYALHYLHQHQHPIIHRDISAPNVLLQSLPTNLYRAKLSDFGSANLAMQSRTTGVGAIIYCAPEMFPTTDVTTPAPPQTTKVDIFSYGILLLEVILKEMPTTEKRSAMLQKIKRQWKTMYDLIIHCTKYSPSDRPTMADILNNSYLDYKYYRLPCEGL